MNSSRFVASPRRRKKDVMRAYIVGDNPRIVGEVRAVLEREHYECEFAAATLAVLERLGRTGADLVVIVLSPTPEAPLAVLREVGRQVSAPRLAVGPGGASELQLEAIRAGADYYVAEEKLRSYLEAVLERLPPRPVHVSRPGQTGRTVAVIAGSSGSGATTLAVNLAAALAPQCGGALLVDLNLGGGDAGTLLNLKPVHTLAELCANSERMDQVMFDRSLTHHDTGIALLAPSQSFKEIKQVTPEGVKKALTLGRMRFPIIVADLADFFHAEQEEVLREADVVLVVFRLDFTSLRNTRRTLDYLEQISGVTGKIRLVANRCGQPNELPAWKVEEALGVPIRHSIPDDVRTVNHANNNGNPAVFETPSSKYARSVAELAATLAPARTS